jgi:hypothetical protein
MANPPAPRVCRVCGYGALSTVEQALGLCCPCLQRVGTGRAPRHRLWARYLSPARRAQMTHQEAQHG